MLNKKQLNYICEQWQKIYNENLKTEYSGFYETLKEDMVRDMIKKDLKRIREG